MPIQATERIRLYADLAKRQYITNEKFVGKDWPNRAVLPGQEQDIVDGRMPINYVDAAVDELNEMWNSGNPPWKCWSD